MDPGRRRAGRRCIHKIEHRVALSGETLIELDCGLPQLWLLSLQFRKCMSDVLGVAKVLKAEGEIDLCLAEGYAANRSYFVPLGELRWCIGENGYRCDIGLDGAPTRAVPVFKDGKIIKWCGTNFMTSTKRQLALPTGDMVSFGMANSDPLLERARAAAEALKAVGLPAVLLRPDRGSLSPIGSSRSCRRSTGVPVIVSG